MGLYAPVMEVVMMIAGLRVSGRTGGPAVVQPLKAHVMHGLSRHACICNQVATMTRVGRSQQTDLVIGQQPCRRAQQPGNHVIAASAISQPTHTTAASLRLDEMLPPARWD